MLEEARGILAVRPALGVLGEAVAPRARAQRDASRPRTGGSSGLTRAELRLLPILSTHLSFREIGERLHVSRNTIKTQAISVYRKLGVSSRSEAVAVAEDLGLVEAAEARADRLELDDPIASLPSSPPAQARIREAALSPVRHDDGRAPRAETTERR